MKGNLVKQYLDKQPQGSVNVLDTAMNDYLSTLENGDADSIIKRNEAIINKLASADAGVQDVKRKTSAADVIAEINRWNDLEVKNGIIRKSAEIKSDLIKRPEFINKVAKLSPKDAKKILLGLLGVGAVGGTGYLGAKTLSDRGIPEPVQEDTDINPSAAFLEELNPPQSIDPNIGLPQNPVNTAVPGATGAASEGLDLTLPGALEGADEGEVDPAVLQAWEDALFNPGVSPSVFDTVYGKQAPAAPAPAAEPSILDSIPQMQKGDIFDDYSYLPGIGDARAAYEDAVKTWNEQGGAPMSPEEQEKLKAQFIGLITGNEGTEVTARPGELDLDLGDAEPGDTAGTLFSRNGE